MIDNRSGAGGALGADIVAKTAPDGYTLLAASAGVLTVAPSVYAKLPYDPVKDFVLSTGSEAALMSPKEFAPYLKADIAKWAKVARAAKIQPE